MASTSSTSSMSTNPNKVSYTGLGLSGGSSPVPSSSSSSGGGSSSSVNPGSLNVGSKYTGPQSSSSSTPSSGASGSSSSTSGSSSGSTSGSTSRHSHSGGGGSSSPAPEVNVFGVSTPVQSLEVASKVDTNMFGMQTLQQSNVPSSAKQDTNMFGLPQLQQSSGSANVNIDRPANWVSNEQNTPTTDWGNIGLGEQQLIKNNPGGYVTFGSKVMPNKFITSGEGSGYGGTQSAEFNETTGKFEITTNINSLGGFAKTDIKPTTISLSKSEFATQYPDMSKQFSLNRERLASDFVPQYLNIGSSLGSPDMSSSMNKIYGKVMSNIPQYAEIGKTFNTQNKINQILGTNTPNLPQQSKTFQYAQNFLYSPTTGRDIITTERSVIPSEYMNFGRSLGNQYSPLPKASPFAPIIDISKFNTGVIKELNLKEPFIPTSIGNMGTQEKVQNAPYVDITPRKDTSLPPSVFGASSNKAENKFLDYVYKNFEITKDEKNSTIYKTKNDISIEDANKKIEIANALQQQAIAEAKTAQLPDSFIALRQKQMNVLDMEKTFSKDSYSFSPDNFQQALTYQGVKSIGQPGVLNKLYGGISLATNLGVEYVKWEGIGAVAGAGLGLASTGIGKVASLSTKPSNILVRINPLLSKSSNIISVSKPITTSTGFFGNVAKPILNTGKEIGKETISILGSTPGVIGLSTVYGTYEGVKKDSVIEGVMAGATFGTSAFGFEKGFGAISSYKNIETPFLENKQIFTSEVKGSRQIETTPFERGYKSKETFKGTGKTGDLLYTGYTTVPNLRTGTGTIEYGITNLKNKNIVFSGTGTIDLFKSKTLSSSTRGETTISKIETETISRLNKEKIPTIEKTTIMRIGNTNTPNFYNELISKDTTTPTMNILEQFSQKASVSRYPSGAIKTNLFPQGTIETTSKILPTKMVLGNYNTYVIKPTVSKVFDAGLDLGTKIKSTSNMFKGKKATAEVGFGNFGNTYGSMPRPGELFGESGLIKPMESTFSKTITPAKNEMSFSSQFSMPSSRLLINNEMKFGGMLKMVSSVGSGSANNYISDYFSMPNINTKNLTKNENRIRNDFSSLPKEMFTGMPKTDTGGMPKTDTGAISKADTTDYTKPNTDFNFRGEILPPITIPTPFMPPFFRPKPKQQSFYKNTTKNSNQKTYSNYLADITGKTFKSKEPTQRERAQTAVERGFGKLTGGNFKKSFGSANFR